MSLVQLYVKGVSYGGNEDSYLFLLEETDGDRQIPLVVNSLEAFSVQKTLEKKDNGTLPFTHGLVNNFIDVLNIHIQDINIFKFSDGIFHSHLVCRKDEKEYRLPARVGDAIAIAYETNAPIFIEEALLVTFGSNNIFNDKTKSNSDSQKNQEIGNLKSYLTSELDSLMKDAIENENYELAAQIHNEITRRKTI